MKRTIVWILLIALLLGGCGQNSVSAELVEETSGGSISVSTVDELLAAIAPNTEIILEAGTYDLSTAANYGEETGSPYYTWLDAYDGYELKLIGVENLTIRGSGMDNTVISAESRYANVISMQNCDGILLEDFTAGHTEEPGECTGGVLVFQGCLKVSANRLGLYGCGMIGIRTDMCSDVSVTDCDIYECSSSGIMMEGAYRAQIKNCRLYELGAGDYGASSVFYLTGCSDVQIENCEVRDNVVQTLISARPCDEVVVKNTAFCGNSVRNGAFDLWQAKESMVLDGNTFEDNTIRIWYTAGDTQAVDGSGNVLTEEVLDEMTAKTEEAEELPEQTQIHVSTVDAFLEAIAPNTKIVLEEAMYDLSTAAGYGKTSGDYYYWVDDFDGPGLVIQNVDNLTICAEDADVKAHTISAIPRYANVLTFSSCSNITVSGFTAGHTEEPGYCIGGVLCFRDCDNVLVDNCSLYGCGTLGVEAEYSGNITVTNCEIYECSYGGIRMWSVDGASVSGCTFRDLGGESIQFSNCKNMEVDGRPVGGDYYG